MTELNLLVDGLLNVYTEADVRRAVDEVINERELAQLDHLMGDLDDN